MPLRQPRYRPIHRRIGRADRVTVIYAAPNGLIYPFCAYNSIYPCPAPWRGNTIPAPIRGGERYAGGGLSDPPDAGAQ